MKTLAILGLVGMAAIGGTAGLGVMGSGDGPGLIAYLHGTGQHAHGIGESLHGGGHGHGGGSHQAMAQLIEQLQLDEAQRAHLDRIHQIMGEAHRDGGPMTNLHNMLIGQFKDGQLNDVELRRAVDEHLEQMRRTAYGITDEIVVLVNSLDSRQRGILEEHLAAAGATGTH